MIKGNEESVGGAVGFGGVGWGWLLKGVGVMENVEKNYILHTRHYQILS